MRFWYYSVYGIYKNELYISQMRFCYTRFTEFTKINYIYLRWDFANTRFTEFTKINYIYLRWDFDITRFTKFTKMKYIYLRWDFANTQFTKFTKSFTIKKEPAVESLISLSSIEDERFIRLSTTYFSNFLKTKQKLFETIYKVCKTGKQEVSQLCIF